MSTQYGTLSHRKSVQVPMWLIVAVVVTVMAIGIGYTVERIQRQGSVATSTVQAFPDTQVAAREGGAVLPATGTAATVFPGGLETSGVIPVTGSGSAFPDTQVAPREGPSSRGTPVEGTSVAAGGMTQPIVINGDLCHQCR